jgi:hypothetical protein
MTFPEPRTPIPIPGDGTACPQSTQVRPAKTAQNSGEGWLYSSGVFLDRL